MVGTAEIKLLSSLQSVNMDVTGVEPATAACKESWVITKCFVWRHLNENRQRNGSLTTLNQECGWKGATEAAWPDGNNLEKKKLKETFWHSSAFSLSWKEFGD